MSRTCWEPSAGEYPIEYEVQLEIGQPTHDANGVVVNGRKWDFPIARLGGVKGEIVTCPHLAAGLPANEVNRWRVRAKNHLGVSKWCDYSYLVFTATGNQK